MRKAGGTGGNLGSGGRGSTTGRTPSAASSSDNVARPKPAQLRREPTTSTGVSTSPTAASIVAGGTTSSYEQQRPQHQSLQQQPYSNRQTSAAPAPSRQSELFAIVVSIKDTFGFLQPLLAEEQMFFSLNGTRGVAIGDEVSYVAKQTPKGMQADNLRPLDVSKKAYLQGVRGVISREPDHHRGTPGLIEVLPEIASQLQQGAGNTLIVPFFAEDFIGGGPGSSNGGGSPSKTQRRIVKGDEIEFTLSKLNGVTLSAYGRGTHCKVLRTKRDRLLAEQVQQMLSVGAVREQGVIETIRNNEFGFIKPADRPEQIYFRMDDVIDGETKINEGSEVEFFVIVENSKGKMSDRAVHLQVLPVGTVIFECAIAEEVLAVVTVTAEPKSNMKDEEPGMARLRVPLPLGGGKPDLTGVELWSRCVPEGFVFKVGDLLTLDVQHYRPEKIHFARGVKVRKYCKLGREMGVVCSVKEQGFGFVRSHLRDADMYFRTSEVLGLGGEMVPESEVVMGLSVSFDVTVDDSNRTGTGAKLKAVRVQRVEPWDVPATLPLSAIAQGGGFKAPSMVVGECTLLDTSVEATANRAATIAAVSGGAVALMQGCVRGVILRDAKRDMPGLIKITSPVAEPRSDLTHPEILDALREFINTPELSEIVLDHIPPTLRKVYQTLLTDHLTGVAYESAKGPGSGGAKSHPLRLWKLPMQEYLEWAQQAQAEVVARGGETDAYGRKLVDMRDMRDMGASHSLPCDEQGVHEVSFLRADTCEDFGPVTKDLEVHFDLCVDKKSNKRVAKTVHLTDAGVVGVVGDQVGLVDVMMVRNGRFGFIRSLPSDEKLFWHSSGAAPGTSVTDLNEGVEVAFQLRRRGGLRCATAIRVLPPGSLDREVVLDGRCMGMIVDDNQVVILDVSQCPAMSNKYWDVTKIAPLLRKEAARVAKLRVAGMATGLAQISLDGAVQGPGSADLPPPPMDFLDEAGDEGEDGEDNLRGAKYFPPLIRAPLPIVMDPVHPVPVPGTFQHQLGDLVQCRVVANWAVSRHPLRAFDVLVASPSTLALGSVGEVAEGAGAGAGTGVGVGVGVGAMQRVKMRGVVTRPHVRVKGGGVDGSGFEFCEVRETIALPLPLPVAPGGVEGLGVGESMACPEGPVFYCDSREPRPTPDHGGPSDVSRESMQASDEVEFIGVRHLGVAVAVQLLPRQVKAEGIVFKRAPVNAVLKSTIKNTGFKGISMAEGPPDDGKTIGFTSGWREEPSTRLTMGIAAGVHAGSPLIVSCLSWGSLLRHLLPAGTILASAPEFVPAGFEPPPPGSGSGPTAATSASN